MKIKFNNRPNNSYNVAVNFAWFFRFLKWLGITKERTIWESRSPALVGVVIAEFEGEEYVLIGKRGDGAADNHGLWNVPCGYLDWNENGYDGICREVYEETGLFLPGIHEIEGIIVTDSHMKQPFFVNTDPKENRQNVSLSYGVRFTCERLPELSIEHCEPGEVSEVKWMKISQTTGVVMGSHDFAFDHDIRINYFLDVLDTDLPF